MTSATSATSEGAQGIFSKITFLKSVRSNEKDEVCHSFVVKIFTKSLHRGGVVLYLPTYVDSDSKRIRQKFYQFFINEKFKKILNFFICILSDYVSHKITKEF